MKTFLSIMLLIILASVGLTQELDSLKNQSVYQRAWDTAMLDDKITSEERALMDILVESLMLSVDSSQIWESRWGFTLPQPLDQTGRWPLVLQNIVIGAGLYGWGIPYVLHADDFRWYTGGVMVSMGSAFYLTYQYTKKREISHSRTQMMRYGSLLGLRYGLGINEIFELDGGSEYDERKTAWAWMLMASVPAGHYGGEYLFKRYNPSNGQAWVWTMWTGVAGVTARSLYNAINPAPEYLDSYYPYDNRQWDRYYAEEADWEKQRTVIELLAYPLGAYAGYQLSKDKQYSFGDALMLFQGWNFGYFNTMMFQSIFVEDDGDEVFFLVNSLGAIGSVLAYDKWIGGDDFSFGQATLMLLGSASGTAFGFGTAILLDITDEEPMLGMALIGYGAGTYLTRQIVSVKPNGSLAHSLSDQVSISPIVLPVFGSDQKVSLIPAFDLRIQFK